VADDRVAGPRYPTWTYLIVVVAVVLAGLWLLGAVVHFLIGLVKVSIVVVLAVAIVAWVVGKKGER